MRPNANELLAKFLTYSGTLPLCGCAIAKLINAGNLDLIFIAQTYSTIIISFLCGIHWAIYIFFADKCSRNLFITSNVIALTAWASLLIADYKLVFLIQILCFLYVFVLDFKLHSSGILPTWFYNLRRNATIIVVLCLLIVTVLE